jgi:hypothetical protein
LEQLQKEQHKKFIEEARTNETDMIEEHKSDMDDYSINLRN